MDDAIHEEVEALRAIYGEEMAVVVGRTAEVQVLSTSGQRALTLLVSMVEGYPDCAPALDLQGKRGVKHDQLSAVRVALEQEAQQLLGMPMVFSLAERAKQLLDELSDSTTSNNNNSNNNNAAAAAVEAVEEERKPLNHQVGNPLIVDGTRCTENVFLSWRERFLEERAARQRAAELKQKELGDDRPTGKQMFLMGLLKNDESLAYRAIDQALAGAEEAPVDESLFKDEI